MQLKKAVRDACPDFALRAYRNIHGRLTPALLGAPVAQMYVNDDDIRTVAGFNNFMSFLNAGVRTSGRLRVVLRNADGVVLLEDTSHLEHFENRFIDVGDMLEKYGVESRVGLISFEFVPDQLRLPAYKQLGLLSSHFFMFYKGRHGGVAMVHPSSTLDPGSPPATGFVSNQIVETFGLEAVTLYQCNPSGVHHAMTLGLQDAATKEVVCSGTLELPPRGTRVISFDASEGFKTDGRRLRVFASSLPTSNSKPMLCRRYAEGRFSMSHS